MKLNINQRFNDKSQSILNDWNATNYDQVEQSVHMSDEDQINSPNLYRNDFTNQNDEIQNISIYE